RVRAGRDSRRVLLRHCSRGGWHSHQQSTHRGGGVQKHWFVGAIAGFELLEGAVAAGGGAPPPPYKAPPPPPPCYQSTGCYVGAGGGYGMYNEELALDVVRALPGIPAGTTFVDGVSQGGRGWFATGQIGCDYQFAGPLGGNWLVGAFADFDWSQMTGNH